MDIEKLRVRRVAARIAGQLLATRAHIDVAKLSRIERGLITPTQAELERLEDALCQLEKAKKAVMATAARVGLPIQGL